MGQVSVVLRNQRPTSDPGPYLTADYRDYVRLFVPVSSELLETSGFDSAPTSAAECGRTVFGGLVVVPPGAERRVEFKYRLPSSIQREGYSLVVQKQPGLQAFPFRMTEDGHPQQESAVGLWTHHTVKMTTNGLSATRWTPSAMSPPSGMSCSVHTDPPRMLAPPASLSVPRINVDAPIESLGIQTDGVLESPSTGQLVGWYAVSARPGQPGNMVMSGHLDLEKRPGVFWRLRELEPGDRLEVRGDDQSQYSYEVEWVREVSATSAPLNDILGPTTERWLTVITCGGPFDARTGEYLSRTVVRARLADSGAQFGSSAD
jgi:LPXTG-site transpeptidase (sortase) family protein